MTNVAHQFLGKVFDRREDTSRDDVALNLGEPEFDLVEPRGVGRREMQMHLRVGLQKFGDPRGLVRREIVRNHMNFQARGLSGHEVRQEGDELLGRVPVGRFAQDFARLRIERGVQGERAMAVIFEAMPFRSPRRQGQHRILTVQGLDRRVLVHTKHGRMLRRVQVETDHIGRLPLEVGIGGGQIPVQAVRLEPVLGPDARHPHMADAEVSRELAGAPVGRAIGRRLPCGLQNTGFHARSLARRGLPAMATVQPGQPLVDKALPPQGHHTATASNLGADGIPGPALGQQQNHPGPPGILGPSRAARCSFHQCSPFRCRQRNGVRHDHHYSL